MERFHPFRAMPDGCQAANIATVPVGPKEFSGASADGGDAAQPEPTPAHPEAAGPNPATAPKPATASISRGRLIGVDVLIGVTTLLLVVGVFAVWANRLLFNPANWSNTSTQLLDNPTIRSSTANYVVDQLYANVNVAALIQSGLPPRLQPLAGPAAGALRNAAVQAVDTALTRPRVQDLWAGANRTADQALVTIVNGGKGVVGINQGVVTLNLAQLIDEVASRLGLPPNLGAKLPSSAANLKLFKSTQLKFVQNVGNGIKGLALWLTILVPVLYALAILLATHRRRRTLMTVGFAAVVGGLLVIILRSIFVNQVVGSLTHDASLRPVITDVVSIMTQMVRQIAAACIFVAVALIAAAWFAGPGRAARASRLAIAPFLRERPVESYALTLAVMGLIFIWDPIHATGTPAGIIVFTALAVFGVYLLRRQTDEEFPDARSGDTARRIRARLEARRQQRTPARMPASPSPNVTEQLRALSELRSHGDITPDEYDAAKARLLHA